MLQSKTNWEYIDTTYDLLNVEESLSVSDISPVMKELLIQRGITSEEEALKFLKPELSHLHNTSLFHTIDVACDRIHKAIDQEEMILVFGDYDADGVTSTTLLIKTLQELKARCDFYIPNRFTEGYGPNEQAFRQAAAEGVSLIITVDCGIASIEEAKIAKELNIDLIITDHHEIQEEAPDAFTIVHPKYSDNYPFKDLAGVGVAFKLSEHLLGYFPEQFLDLVSIGTVADMVPLKDENRVLTYFGLQELTKTKRLGLIALKKQCNIEGDVSEEDIGFRIGPRLNAVGRLEDASLAVELLLTDDQEAAVQLAETVELLNKERQQKVSKLVSEAEKMVQPDQNVIVIAKEDWNVGILGIVASRLAKKFNRPTIVLSIDPVTMIAKGSARSIQSFNIFDTGMQLRHLFIHFGGHSQAAGMSLQTDNLEELSVRFNELIDEQLKAEDYKQVIKINKHLQLPEINEALIDEIDELAPFGIGNPKPLFHVKCPAQEIRQLGHLNNHLKIQFKYDNHVLEAIGFGFGDLYSFISPRASIEVVGKLGINEWNGIRKPQIMIEDVKVKEWQLFDHRGKKNIDYNSFVSENQTVIIVGTQEFIDTSKSNVVQLSYEEDSYQGNKADQLFLFELPSTIEELKLLVTELKPNNIHLCFQVNQSTYLSQFPSRDDFKWFYGQILKQQVIDLNKEINLIINAKGWSKENIVFMSKVFLELEFVKIKDGVIKAEVAPQKKDLDVSTIYQKRLNKADIEKQLYYSKNDELYRLFVSFMDLETSEEEVIHGL